MSERKRRSGKNRLAEIQKPRGYDRGLQMQGIVGATDYTGTLMYLVRWENCDEYDLLPSEEVNEKNPQEVIRFYEQRGFAAKVKDRFQPNKPIAIKPAAAVAEPAAETAVDEPMQEDTPTPA